ncbi:helix-turn-helix domain-containing protein [Streptomyces kaniharaensis]|uniref:Helix-turn-helix domain-containing protein n=1 Tax=Streptomyces kaniharaensis TaxID=212423 RepID=A0A6N7L585_9ACTN|nr:helix-turn-helix domain-containing protein [Streptomyces kaniharaensis]MQS17113.1 helix-turn-helix domain-containing protein [Streptomyces kaniharaensis]
MNGDRSDAGGAFRLDSTIPGGVPRAFDVFLGDWRTHVGDGFPMPGFTSATMADFRVSARAARVGDVAITDMMGASALRTAGALPEAEDQVRLYAVYRGAWTLGDSPRHSSHTVVAGPAKAVALGRFDDVEPRLAPALTQAAKDIADSLLADPGLSAAMLAGRLNVSVRTLHRAFATTQESVTAYIRRRRLEEARLALSSQPGRPAISEIAAHWQFADSSHFSRAFKRQYGQAPTDYVRSGARLCGHTGRHGTGAGRSAEPGGPRPAV